jgi:predicted TIM-barrel fold metal-dependent hydrolase
LAAFIGEDNLLIGSDYGHNDPAEEKALVDTMRSRADLSSSFLEKIFTGNPTRFYGLT